jgi:nucleotide-binding universal stress UspA family protein
MNSTPIDHVLCAVRGGPESRDTVKRAIAAALEHNARLTFFHVVDAEFMGHTMGGTLRSVYQQLTEMSQFAMLILCDRARMRGVDRVDYLLREGNVKKQLLALAIETRAQILVMGKPTRSPTRNQFQPGELEEYAEQLRVQGGLELIVVTPEPVAAAELDKGLQF